MFMLQKEFLYCTQCAYAVIYIYNPYYEMYLLPK